MIIVNRYDNGTRRVSFLLFGLIKFLVLKFLFDFKILIFNL